MSDNRYISSFLGLLLVLVSINTDCLPLFPLNEDIILQLFQSLLRRELEERVLTSWLSSSEIHLQGT